MKILRLTNSSDVHPGVPPEQRSPAIAERIVSEAVGQPVETVVKGLWPNEGFPDVLERWLRDLEPDVVFIRLSSFWVAYESVPKRVERLPAVGRPLARVGLRLGDRPWLIERATYKAARGLFARTVGGDTHFTPAQVGRTLDESLRRVVRNESIVPVVRGTNLLLNSAGTRAGLDRSKRRVRALNVEAEVACARHRVRFFPEAPAKALSATRLEDDLHDSAEAHLRLGTDDGNAILEALGARG